MQPFSLITGEHELSSSLDEEIIITSVEDAEFIISSAVYSFPVMLVPGTVGEFGFEANPVNDSPESDSVS